MFCGEELTHLIAVTREVVACHAEILKELGYGGYGKICRDGSSVHLTALGDNKAWSVSGIESLTRSSPNYRRTPDSK